VSGGAVQVQPALLTDDQSAALLGVSVRKFHALRGEPWWPVKAVALGPRLLRWPAAELLQAIAAMPRQETTGSEPAQLRRAKIERMKRGVPA
jgi:predicted DNA-binding transcriptional regulator AlpA